MPKYTYDTVTGAIEVDVDCEWLEILSAEDGRQISSQRKHSRADHKYAPGSPSALDAVDPENAWVSGGNGSLDETEFQIDLEAAMDTLTDLQKYCFVEICLKSRTYRDIAQERGKSLGTITDAVSASREKIKKIF